MILGGLVRKYAFGQGLSLLLACTGLINECLSTRHHVNIPALQTALAYTTLLGGATLYRAICCRSPAPSLRRAWGTIAGAGIFDVVASLLVVRAFAGLSLPEVTVYSSLSTPTSFLLAHLCARSRPRHTALQSVGLLIALGAIVFYMWITQEDCAWSLNWHAVCAMGSAIAYAVSNTLQERASHQLSASTLLLRLSVIGTASSWMLLLVGARGELVVFADASPATWLLILSYALLLALFYALIPAFLSRYSAVCFNLSLLTSSFYGVIAGWLMLHGTHSRWLYATILLVNLGLFLHHAAGVSGKNSNGDDKLAVRV